MFVTLPVLRVTPSFQVTFNTAADPRLLRLQRALVIIWEDDMQ